jgi:PAS domain S-box-containing protein
VPLYSVVLRENERVDDPTVAPIAAAAEPSLRAADAIIEISADAVISIDDQQRIIRFNRGAEEIFGYARSEMLGRPLDLLLPERFRGLHSQHVTRFGNADVSARRMGERRPISGLRANGEEFPAEASISKVDIAGERIYTVVLRDISDRQRAERASQFLARAGELLAGSLDTTRTLEQVAQLALPLMGDWCVGFIADDAMVVRRALAAHHDPARAQEMLRLRSVPFRSNPAHPATQALQEGQSQLLASIDDTQLLALADDAEHLEVLRSLNPRSLIAVPLKARDRILGALCFFFERSQRAHDEEDLALAEELARRAALALDNARLYGEATAAIRARDDVLAVVSHDLGNPLSAVRVNSAVLLRRHSEDDPDRIPLANIRGSVEQMERLIGDLLDVKRIEAGMLSLEREPLVVSALLADIAEAAQTWIDGRVLRLEADGSVDGLRVFADPQRVFQVFSNLVGNAARYSPQGSDVALRVAREGNTAVFSVSDAGPGIPAEHLPHIFDRFWQARRTGRHGIGLGLAIVKGIVEAHGGRAWAESELGTGSTFYFTLPLHEPARA